MTARYFMPWTAHPSLAVTGSQCLSACALFPGTVAQGVALPPPPSPCTLNIEHPMGTMDVRVVYDNGPGGFNFISAGVTRTARLIARGEVLVPAGLIP
jgi:2-methylaconitate cis-trans-isomerase PrpF